MLFACEYCYGTELVLAGLASGGFALTWCLCWIKRVFNRKHKCECESCDCETHD